MSYYDYETSAEMLVFPERSSPGAHSDIICFGTFGTLLSTSSFEPYSRHMTVRFLAAVPASLCLDPETRECVSLGSCSDGKLLDPQHFLFSDV